MDPRLVLSFYIVEDDHELLILQPLLFQCWDLKYAPPYLVCGLIGFKSRTSMDTLPTKLQLQPSVCLKQVIATQILIVS